MDTIIDLLKVEYVCSKHSGVTCLFVAVGAYVIILKILGVWLYKQTRNVKNGSPIAI